MNTPRKAWSAANPLPALKETFLLCIQADPDAVKLFSNLADMPATTRLSVNLRIICTLLSRGPVEDVLRDGLTTVEKETLLRIEDLLPEALLEVAHGLLNVHERWLLVRTLSKPFRQANQADLTPVEKPLNSILGEVEDGQFSHP